MKWKWSLILGFAVVFWFAAGAVVGYYAGYQEGYTEALEWMLDAIAFHGGEAVL